MPDTQAFREKYRMGRRLCSLLPYVLVYGSLQPCWWCISAYVSQVYIGSIPWGVPSCHAMILWRWDTFLPHLLSSASNCVSAVSLLTAPYTVLRLRRNSFWCLLPTVFDRAAYLMDNTELDTCIGEYALYGIREAFQTINAAYQYIPDTSVLKIA